MATIDMTLPSMGESVMEATVINWLKNVGDSVSAEEPLLEVATDKVDTEIVSPADGVITELLVGKGDVVPIGGLLAKIATHGSDAVSVAQNTIPTEPNTDTLPLKTEILPRTETEKVSRFDSQTVGFLSPLVKQIIKTEQLTGTEISQIKGSGLDGRINKQDILAYVASKKQPHPTKKAPEVVAPKPQPKPININTSATDEVIEMDRMRRMIADRMVESKRISPHVTSFIEADVTGLIAHKNNFRHEVKDKFGAVLTVDAYIVEAVAKALIEYPRVNASVDGYNLIVKKNINVGSAVALKDGNLIVPVVKNADKLSLAELASAVYNLSKKALKSQLSPDDLAGGTFSISNVGAFGSLTGTPIILQPQIGILAFGAVKKKPAVIETPQGDFIGIRQIMMLAHTYDHRVIDGALGGKFLKKVADVLESYN